MSIRLFAPAESLYTSVWHVPHYLLLLELEIGHMLGEERGVLRGEL